MTERDSLMRVRHRSPLRTRHPAVNDDGGTALAAAGLGGLLALLLPRCRR